MNDFIGTWGCVFESRFIEAGSREAFEREHMTGTTMQYTGMEGCRLVLQYRDSTYLADPEGFWRRPTPDFTWDQPVTVRSKDIKANVELICWHYNDERYFYHVVGEDGKRLKKRYFAEDLEPCERG